MTKAMDEIGRLFGEGTLAGLSDGQLLERFANRGDGGAFEAIVVRHGPLVLSACRSSLGPRDRAEAEDALQATFLILARRAGSFPLDGSLAGWLYRVARRVARQARLGASRRRAREQVAAGRAWSNSPSPHDPAAEEVRDLIHQEVARLPERYRAPILLCDLHGLTRDEAAEAIGCPPGTVAGRLARARELLRGRLARRGVASPTIVGLAALDHPTLFRAASRAVVASTRGEAVAVAVARLAARASGRWFGTPLSGGFRTLAALAASGVAAVAIAFGILGNPVDPPKLPLPPPSRVLPPAAEAEAEGPIPDDPDDPALADIFAGKVVDEAGKPVAGAKVYLARVEPAPPDAGPVRATTGVDGRFRFSAKDMTFTSFDGLPARRPGLLIAAADALGADCVPTWGHQPPVYPPHMADKKVADWTLTLPSDVPIRGRLLGPEGRPLAGAIVRLESLLLPWKEEAVAELEKLEFPNMAFDDMHNQRPRGQGATILNRGREFIADADGRFRIAGLGRDRLAQLIIREPGVAETRASVVTRAMPEIRKLHAGWPDDVTFGADFTLALERGQVVPGMVRDRATGLPLSGVRVDFGGSPTGRPSILSDAKGRFSIDGISPLGAGGVLDLFATPEPGRPHLPGKVRLLKLGEAVIDCPAGVPFRLTLLDEAGRPVEAEVAYSALYPNEAFTRLFWNQSFGGPVLSTAARQADGSYLGVVLPGPGAVTVKLPPGVPYRPADVDPKAFFAPGKKGWTLQEQISTYGNLDTLSALYGGGPSVAMQEDYAAIVLVNPAEGSKPLELSATVRPPRPRMVTLVDPEGRPFVGATTRGMTFYFGDQEPRLRASTFPLTKLHPDRSRRITFFDEGRKRIGFLMARGDGDSPYIVTMEPWAAVTGRFVDERGGPVVFNGPGTGNPGPVSISSDEGSLIVAIEDPKIGDFPWPSVGVDGRFRAERIVPGQVYSASYATGIGGNAVHNGKLVDHATFAPGEVRDLGDIRTPIKPRDAGTPPSGR